MYCACIVWYEELPPAVALDFLQQLEIAPEIPPEGGPEGGPEGDALLPTAHGLGAGLGLPTVHAPEAVCLLSRVPVFEGLMECCRQLFRMKLQSAGGTPETWERLLEALLTTRLPGEAHAPPAPAPSPSHQPQSPALSLGPQTQTQT